MLNIDLLEISNSSMEKSKDLIHSLACRDRAQTMSSREIADLVEIRHDNAKRTIDKLFSDGLISRPQIEDGIKSANGVIEKLYIVGKRDSFVIVAQLSPAFTARLVDRWQELESQAKFVLPQTLPDALRLAADLADQKNRVEAELALVAPKAKAFDRVSTFADGALCLTDAAKILQQQPKRFFVWLKEIQWIFKRSGSRTYKGYQNRIQAGLLEVKTTTIEKTDGSEKICEQVLITAKGLMELSKELNLRDTALAAKMKNPDQLTGGIGAYVKQQTCEA